MSTYTEKQCAALINAAPVSFDDAKKFADDFGVSTQSVIGKVKSLGIDYIPKAPTPKRAKGATKAKLVDEIAGKLNADLEKLDGLANAKASALAYLLDAIPS